MLLADLKGKLSLSELVSEDFLTSSVFSFFKYMDKKWFEKFIRSAINIEDHTLDIQINEPPLFVFWPWYSNDPKYGNGAEPDVVIFSGESAIIVEAKNYSGKSGSGVESELNEKQQLEKKIVDQLGKEYFVGLNKLKNSHYKIDNTLVTVNEFYLVYLTRHNLFPKDEICETIKAIMEVGYNEVNPQKRLYWINWQKVVPILEEIISTCTIHSFENKFSKDLIEFMDRRDLGIFSGYGFLKKDFEVNNLPKKIFYHEESHDYWNFLKSFHFPCSKSSIYYTTSIFLYWRHLNSYKDIFESLTTSDCGNIFFKGGIDG